jgi:hypothetical protein
MRDAQLENIAARHYNSTLAYHNFGHVVDALGAMEGILSRCKARGEKLNQMAAYYGVLFHDAGYHEDHQAKGFAHKEDYSAQIAESILAQRKVPKETIALACDAIRATRKGSALAASPEILVVRARAADLAQLAAPYPVFKLNTVRLWKEHEQMSGKTVGWGEWRVKAVPDVEYFLKQRLFVEPGQSENEVSAFLKQAAANLAALAKDNETS